MYKITDQKDQFVFSHKKLLIYYNTQKKHGHIK